ncbi:MAG: hypothetical protein ACTSUE_10115 [Promethearchaeota archaeon]
MSKVIFILKGGFTSRSLKFYILVNYSIAIVFLFLATLTLHLESGFSFMDDDISATGSPDENPTGWFFFSIFLIYGGLFMVPICIFYNKAMKRRGYNARLAVSTFYAIGCIGTALVGIFPSSVNRVCHLTSAVLAFGGYGMGFVVYFVINVYRRRWKTLLPYLVFFPIIGGLVVTQGIVIFTADADFDAFRGTILSISLWEWLMFFSIVFMFVVKAYMLSKDMVAVGLNKR